MAGTTIIGRVGVKVYPDTSGFYRELKGDLRDIERRAEVEVPVKVNDRDAIAEAKRALRAMQAAMKDLKVDVDVDRSKLKDLTKDLQYEVEINLADVDRSNLSIDELGDHLEEVGRKTIDLKSDMRELKREIDRTMDDRKKWEPIDDAYLSKVAKFTDDIDKLNEISDIELDLHIKGMTRAQREVLMMKQELQRLEKQYEVAIRADLDRESRDRLLVRIENLRDDIEDKLDDIPANIDPEVDEAWYRRAQARLAWLTRPRTVPILPKVDNKAARLVTAQIAALSGGRLLQNTLRQLRDLFRNIDKNLPLIAGMANAIGLLGAAGLAAGSNLFALSASLAQIALAGLALPGIFGGLAIGLVTTAVALKDISERVPQFVERWSNLKNVVRDNFWAEAAEPIDRLGNVLFPQLERGLAASSTQIGHFFGAFANHLALELVDSMGGMFADLAKSIEIATATTGDMARIIRILGEQGAGQLPRLAQWFADVTENFSKFLDEANESGKLTDWINTGIEAIKDLGNVAYQAGRILGALGTAASEAGGAGLKELGDGLERIANTVNGPAFREGLIRTLQGAHKAMDNISTISGPALENMFIELSHTFERVLPVIGATVGELLDGIADAIAQPELQQGLRDFFDDINHAVRALKPALEPVGVALGDLFKVMGTAARTFAPMLEAALSTLGKMFSNLAGPIGTVVESLGGAFAGAIEALSPGLVKLSQALGPVIEKLGTQLAQALVDSTPAIVELATSVGDFLVTALDTLGPSLIKVLDALLPVVAAIGTDLLEAVVELLPELAPLVTELGVRLVEALEKLAPQLPAIIASLGELLLKIIPLLPALVPLVAKFLEFAVDVLPGLIDAITPLVENLATLVTSFTENEAAMKLLELAIESVGTVINGLSSIIEGVGKVLGGFTDLAIGIFEDDGPAIEQAFKRIWEGFGDIVEGAFKTVFSAIATAIDDILEKFDTSISDMREAGEDLIQGAIDGILGFLGGLKDAIGRAADTIINTFKRILGINSPSTVFAQAGRDIMQGLINGIRERISQVASAIRTAADRIKSAMNRAPTLLLSAGRQVITGLVNGIRDGFGRVTSALSSLRSRIRIPSPFSILVSAGRSVVSGLISGIRSMFGSVASTLGSLTQMIIDKKGPPKRDAVLLTPAGKSIIQSLISGMESEYGNVEDSLDGLTNRLASRTFEVPAVEVNASRLRRATDQNYDSENGSASALAGRGGPVVNVTNINPVAEPPSETVNKTMQSLAVLEI